MAATWGGQVAWTGLSIAAYLPIAAIAVARVGWWEYTRSLPSVEALADYQPAAVTVLYDRDGEVLGELFVERRYELPIDRIPQRVQDAFVAAEDGSFWSHGGVDWVGVARAAWKNVDEGRAAQGASTITQQVVKNLVLNDPHKTLRRKLDEAALAWEVESRFDKPYILELYLNSIFFGASSYGVEAAARSYFGKHVDELTLGEAALLAGLPQRPSDYNPFRNLPRARERQAYVLARMVDQGFATEAEANAALAAPIVLRPSKNTFLDNAPHFTEHVRRWLVAELGEDVVNRGGLQVVTTCDLTLQRAAQEAVHDRVTELDRASGLRRAGRRTLPADEILDWRASHPVDGPLAVGTTYEGVVTAARSDQLVVAVGTHELGLLAQDHPWISPRHRSPSFDEKVASADEREAYWRRIEAQREAAAAELLAGGLTEAPAEVELPEAPGVPLVQVGDLVRVSPVDGDLVRVADGRRLPRATLVQPRELEGALLSMELGTGAVRALVGGADFEGSQFNRAIQGRRQVGSTFKPFVYAAAIASRKYTAATVVSDDPLSIDLGRGNAWTPRNYGRDSMPPMTIAQGLARSRNLVLVRTMIGLDEWMDGDVVYTFARALGLGGPPTAALPDGWTATPDSQYLCPWTNERKSAWYCRDHQPPLPDDTDRKAHRRALPKETDHLCRSCDYSIGLGSASLTLAEMVRAYSAFGTPGQLVEPYFVQEVRDRDGNVLLTAHPEPLQVIDPGVAYVTNFLLRGVVERGTARDALGLGVPVAGKTGTTDEGRDAWFIGMTPELLTGVWVGFDQPQPISERATGSRIALPIFVRYTREAVAAGRLDPARGWPEPVPGSVSFAPIDERTGGRLDGGRRYPFLPGTEPGTRSEAPAAALDEPGLAELE